MRSPFPSNHADLETVYCELRNLARVMMTNERAGHTLQPTALVHEAWARLAGSDAARWASPEAFAVLAAEAMRRVLIDHARAKAAVKRGGATVSGEGTTAARKRREVLVVEDVEGLLAGADPDAIEQLEAALARLELKDPTASQIVRLRFYGGFSIEETAAALEMSPATVKRDWQFARAWLYQTLEAS